MKIVFASANPHKLEEIKAMLPEGIVLLSPPQIGFNADVEESGSSFEENAEIKASALFDHSGIISFADDSGLEVKALKGQPGVKSARFAGEPVDHDRNISLLLEKMKDKKDRSARFVTVICLKTKDKTLYFEGEVKGKITEERMGNKGFGYDPVFMPEGEDRTFAMMSPEEKNQISHRKMAMIKFTEFLPFVQ